MAQRVQAKEVRDASVQVEQAECTADAEAAAVAALHLSTFY